MILGGEDRQPDPSTSSMFSGAGGVPRPVGHGDPVSLGCDRDPKRVPLDPPRVAFRLTGARIDVLDRPLSVTAWSLVPSVEGQSLSARDRPDLFPGVRVDDAEHPVRFRTRKQPSVSCPADLTHRFVEPIRHIAGRRVHDDDTLEDPSAIRPTSTPAVGAATWGAVATDEPSYEYGPTTMWPGATSRRPRPIPSRRHREMTGSTATDDRQDSAVGAHVDRPDLAVEGPDLLGGNGAPSARSKTLIRPNRLPQ